MGANELSMQLWRERELLEMLLFKLDEQQLLLAAGRSHWIQFAAREIDQVLDRLRAASLARAVEVAGVAEEWGLLRTRRSVSSSSTLRTEPGAMSSPTTCVRW